MARQTIPHLFTFGFAIVFTFPAIIMAVVFVTFHLSDGETIARG